MLSVAGMNIHSIKIRIIALSALCVISVAGALLGYGLYATGIIPDIIIYHLLNLFGSIGVAAISYYRKVWQPAIINTCFAVFATIAVIRHFL